MPGLVRTVMYVAVFAGVVVIFVPVEALQGIGLSRPDELGLLQFVGIAITLIGLAIALWSVVTFALVGRGTPLPFDPPRHLVRVGPYAFVRNPMAIGVGSVLLGVAVFYRSAAVFAFTMLFMLVIQAMVTLYEEPILRQTFGAEYDTYCSQVKRWVPRGFSRSNDAR